MAAWSPRCPQTMRGAWAGLLVLRPVSARLFSSATAGLIAWTGRGGPVRSAGEAFRWLVPLPVFKTGVAEDLGQAGSIPVRLRPRVTAWRPAHGYDAGERSQNFGIYELRVLQPEG